MIKIHFANERDTSLHTMLRRDLIFASKLHALWLGDTGVGYLLRVLFLVWGGGGGGGRERSCSDAGDSKVRVWSLLVSDLYWIL